MELRVVWGSQDAFLFVKKEELLVKFEFVQITHIVGIPNLG